MRGFVNIPMSVYCKGCKYCGARPIVALAGPDGYVVKCPQSNAHYHTKPGLIDIEDWNIHNIALYDNDNDYSFKMNPGI